MKTEIYTCDKCKEDFNRLEHFDNLIHRNQFNLFEFDLCKDCIKKLKKWLKEEK